MADIVPQLSNYLGKNIKDICTNGYHNNNDNHCAHFVSHVMGFSFGFLCRMMTGKGNGGATIRVHELFAKCGSVGQWEDKPSQVSSCLVFVTSRANVDLKSRKMANVPKKHVGIYHNKEIYHYSNTQDKVIKQTVGLFSKHYRGNDITVYYGELPKCKS